MDKYIGKRLGGRYDIKELIGVGGMANVYKAVDIIENRVVAVKILKDEFLSNDEFLRRFRNESKAIAVLSHPNIVKIYDVSLGDGIQYLVMEHVDGITLKEYIEQQHVLKWKEAVHFTVQILRALQHAHDKGIVHRDVKPHNIMLLQDGTIKVMDFGIARFARDDGRTVTDKAIGSVHYISPEQARGDITDEKSDIYSVGVMLFEMLTGKLPFDSDSAVSIALMQMQAVPKMPRQLNETIPEGLEEITVRSMQKDPSQRYQSAAEMLRDIDEFKRNPSILFEYKYFDDQEKTKYFDAVDGKVLLPDSVNTQEEEEEEEEEEKSKIIPILLAVASAFVVFVIAFLIILVAGQSKLPDLRVPNVVGMSFDELQNDPEYADFIYEMSNQEFSDKYAKGLIISQSIEAGSSRKQGTKITVVVSSGRRQISVPDVSGLTYSEAKAQLENDGFAVKQTKTSDPTVEKDLVVKTQPAMDELAEEGSTVIVVISTGPAASPQPLPNVVGATKEIAKAQLEAAGFVVEFLEEDSDKEAGTVIQQVPDSETAEKGQTITLVISTGQTEAQVATIQIELPDGLTATETFNIYDSTGTLVETKSIPMSLGSFSVNVSGTGTATYNVLIGSNNSRYASYNVDFATKTVTRTYQNESVFENTNTTSSEATTSSDIEEPSDITSDITTDQTQPTE